MLGKKFHLTALDSRKKLLVLESELNRAHLVREIGAVKHEIHNLSERIRSAGAIASMTANVISTLSDSFLNGNSSKGQRRFFSLGNVARAGVGIWKLFRSRSSK
jgi:hypothetical protein